MSIRLLEIDRPTINGRIYSRKVIEAAIAAWIEKAGKNQMFIFSKPTTDPQFEDVIGLAENLRIEDGYLIADIKLVKEKMDEVFEGQSGEFCIRPNGIGGTDPETGMVLEGYKIHGLVIRHKPKPTNEKE
jgi:hypothetical protein